MTISANADDTVKFTGPEGSYIDGKAKIELKNQGGLIVRTKITYTADNRIFVNNGGNLEIKVGGDGSVWQGRFSWPHRWNTDRH